MSFDEALDWLSYCKQCLKNPVKYMKLSPVRISPGLIYIDFPILNCPPYIKLSLPSQYCDV